MIRVYAAAAAYRDEGRIVEHHADRDVTFGTFRTRFERATGDFAFDYECNEGADAFLVRSDGDPFLQIRTANDFPLPPASSLVDAIATITGITMGAAYYVPSLLFRAGLGGTRWLQHDDAPLLRAEVTVDERRTIEIALGHAPVDERLVVDARTFAILRVVVPQAPLTEDQRRRYAALGMPRPRDHEPALTVVYEPTLE